MTIRTLTESTARRHGSECEGHFYFQLRDHKGKTRTLEVKAADLDRLQLVETPPMRGPRELVKPERVDSAVTPRSSLAF